MWQYSVRKEIKRQANNLSPGNQLRYRWAEIVREPLFLSKLEKKTE
jgi:hypothetical protein